jgi:antitoxin HicB
MAATPKKYIVTDGELTLVLEPDDGWYCVTSPFDPEIITQARTLEEAFEMARDVVEMFKEYRANPTPPAARPKAGKRTTRTAPKKSA